MSHPMLIRGRIVNPATGMWRDAPTAERTFPVHDEPVIKCPACDGYGGVQVTRFWGRGPNECYPDAEECGFCTDGPYGVAPGYVTASGAVAIVEALAAIEAEIEAAEEAQSEAMLE